MTVIAYRDGVMASDSLLTDGGTRLGNVKKVFRGPDGALGGAGGDAGSCAAFGKWIGEGHPVGTFKPEPGDRGFCALLVLEGLLCLIDARGRLIRIDAPFAAEGSGRDVALGAMEMGATAEEAVAAAIKWDTGCGGPVQVERLERVPEALVQRFPLTDFGAFEAVFQRAAAD